MLATAFPSRNRGSAQAFGSAMIPQPSGPDVDTPAKIKTLKEIVKHGAQRDALQSVYFLFVGASLVLLGFGFASWVGMVKFREHVIDNYRGEPMPSGINYFPLTVSEMIRDPSTVETKCFFAFCIAGAICILVSSYPWRLKNTYIGDDAGLPINPKDIILTCMGCSVDDKVVRVPYLFFRQFLPPIGMMLVICITVTSGERNFVEKVGAIVHTVGAVMMIGGYIAFEIHALWFCALTKNIMGKRELRQRKFLIIICAICAVGFQVFGTLHTNMLKGCMEEGCSCTDEVTDFYKTCMDVYVIPTEDDIDHLVEHKRYDLLPLVTKAFQEGRKTMLENTAMGWILAIKKANYWCEAGAGIAMVASHLCIWFWCKERKIDLAETMPDYTEVDGYSRMSNE